MALENFKAPALPLAPAEYTQQHMSRVLQALRLYFNQLDSDAPHRAYTYRANGVLFNLDGIPDLQTGQFAWNNEDGTLNLGLEYGSILQLGQELMTRVGNDTGSLIPNGTVVGYTGAGSLAALTVAPFIADNTQSSQRLLGVITHDLPDSGNLGYCTVWGKVRGINTTGTPYSESWSVGDILYASPTVAGGFTKVKPTAPDNCIPVATVTKVGASDGEIFVRPLVEQQQLYGTFVKNTTQSPLVINTEYLLTFDVATVSNGVTIGTPTSRIVVGDSGLYTIELTLQVSSTSASSKNLWVWFKKNGTAIPESARILTTDINNGYQPLTLVQAFSLDANDYMEIAFAANDINLSIATVAPTAFAPEAPAAVLAVTQSQL